MEIHKYGFIKGGVCEGRLNRRFSRAKGSWMAWFDIKDDPEYIRVKNGWYQLLKEPKGRKIGEYGGCDCEIGYLRMLEVVFSQLVKNKTKFRMKWMEKWIEGIASCEFGVAKKPGQDRPLAIITPGEGVHFGLAPPKGSDDVIYEKLYGVPAGLVK